MPIGSRPGSEPAANESTPRITPDRHSATIRRLSIVVPAFNEAGNLAALIDEIDQAMAALGMDHEVLVVDDGSTDRTPALLAELGAIYPSLRGIRLPANRGQSAALMRGVLDASADWVATLDGDGQNVPADFARLIDSLEQATDHDRIGMIAGVRQRRNDPWIKRLSSRIANAVRQRILHDGCPDTGCGIKLLRRELFLRCARFDHMHRFLPALCRMHGMDVITVAVAHRPRRAGQSNYGTWDRLRVGVVDLLGVLWLRRRTLRADEELPGDPRQ